MAGYGVAGGVAEGFGGVMTWVEEVQLASKADVDGKADLDPVTGKVVASQLPSGGGGGGGGGGGAGIDDGATGADTTWSSQKIDAELASKAEGQSALIDEETGELSPGPFPSLGYQVAVAYMWAAMALKATNEFDEGVNGMEIVSALPEYPTQGTLYGVRAPDGTISFHMPAIPA